VKARPKKPHRVRWQVLALPGVLGWAVIRDDAEDCRFFFKFRAVSYAAKQAEFEWEEHGQRGELLIHGRNGVFQDSRSYGSDPREIKG
jgi:hypothetical protein